MLCFYIFDKIILLKACRPIPVIILSALIAKKFHSLWKWLAVVLITTGISVFIYDEDSNIEHSSKHADVDEKLLLLGDALLFSSLLFDGCTSAFQVSNALKLEIQRL